MNVCWPQRFIYCCGCLTAQGLWSVEYWLNSFWLLIFHLKPGEMCVNFNVDMSGARGIPTCRVKGMKKTWNLCTGCGHRKMTFPSATNNTRVLDFKPYLMSVFILQSVIYCYSWVSFVLCHFLNDTEVTLAFYPWPSQLLVTSHPRFISMVQGFIGTQIQ